MTFGIDLVDRVYNGEDVSSGSSCRTYRIRFNLFVVYVRVVRITTERVSYGSVDRERYNNRRSSIPERLARLNRFTFKRKRSKIETDVVNVRNESNEDSRGHKTPSNSV